MLIMGGVLHTEPFEVLSTNKFPVLKFSSITNRKQIHAERNATDYMYVIINGNPFSFVTRA